VIGAVIRGQLALGAAYNPIPELKYTTAQEQAFLWLLMRILPG
jgi:hypothetical protein